MAVKQISVFLENRPGTLEELTKIIAEAEIDMRALSLAETKDFGIVRFIADDAWETANLLKEKGYVAKLTSVLAVQVPDQVGGLNSLLHVLNEAGINIEYMYASLADKDDNTAYMILRVEDVQKAEAALLAKGIETLDQETVSQ